MGGDGKGKVSGNQRLKWERLVGSVMNMTVSQIIEEIQRLSPDEQTSVIRFAYQLDAARNLTGRELSALAQRLVEAKDEAEAVLTRDAIIRGFYGNETHA